MIENAVSLLFAVSQGLSGILFLFPVFSQFGYNLTDPAGCSAEFVV